MTRADLAQAVADDSEAREALEDLVSTLWNVESLDAENRAWTIFTDRIAYLITKNRNILHREENKRIDLTEDEEHA